MTNKEVPETNTPSSVAEISAGSGEAVAGNYIQRRSQWRSSLDALVYIFQLYRKPEVQVRETDKVTGVAVLFATIATFSCLLLHRMSGVGMQLTLLCDFFLGLSLTIYICNRLGILTGMQPRQAMLAWQLIKAFCFVGVFITVNLSIIITLALSSVSVSTIKTPFFHH